MEDKLSKEESAILSIVRLNKETPRTEIKKAIAIGRLQCKFEWRSSKNLWGRFGGGWNWKLGIMAGGRTMIVDVLIFSLCFNWKEKLKATV